MYLFEKIPNFVFDLLKQKGADVQNIYIGTYCDMDSCHNFCDTYLFASKEQIYILSGSASFERERGFSNKIDKIWNESDFRTLDICDIESIHVEELISSSRIVAKKTNGENVFVCAMTNFCKGNAGLFCKYFSRIKKGEITSPDFEMDKEDDPKENSCPKCGMRYPDRNRKVCPHCMEKGKLFARFSVFLFKYKKEIAILIATLSLITVMGILGPYFSGGFFLDEVLKEGGSLYGEVLVAVGIIVATKLSSVLLEAVNGYFSSKIAAKMVYDLKNTIFGAIERLSMGFFSARQTGGLMTQVNNDSNNIYSFFCDGLPPFLINIVKVVVLVVVLFVMNAPLAALTLLTIPVFFFLLRFTYSVQRKYHAKNYTCYSRMNGHLSDVLGGIRVVKAFAKESEEEKRFTKLNRDSSEIGKKQALFGTYTFPYIGLILYLGNIISLGVGGYMVIRGIGGMSYGKLITFTAYVNMIYSPMYYFSNMIDWYAGASNALQRLFEIYDAEPDITEKKDAVKLENMCGKVEFKNVDFGYSKHRKVIDDVSFTVESGKTLGIVGHTGAGKSTIANLIMRLYDTDEGGVYIDGVNVKDLSFETLYSNIAIVSQETYLFIGTIFDNIRYARPDATYDEVIFAAKCAGAHEFIMRLPDAYNTKIGFGYKDLSGGERQRVSIARAILRNPKILILDEATAAMDTKTEKLIQNALTTLTKDKTTIMIAHRLSTLRDADNLIVIEHGKVAESGTHKELLAKDEGVYKKLYTLQLEALKNAGIAE